MNMGTIWVLTAEVPLQESVGGSTKNDVQQMFSAVVGNMKGIRLKNSASSTSHKMYFSSTPLPSSPSHILSEKDRTVTPVKEDIRKVKGKLANSGSLGSGRMAVKLARVRVSNIIMYICQMALWNARNTKDIKDHTHGQATTRSTVTRS